MDDNYRYRRGTLQLTPDQVRHSFRGYGDFLRQGRADFKSPPVDRIEHTAVRQTSECPSELNRVGKAHSMRRAPKCHMRQCGRSDIKAADRSGRPARHTSINHIRRFRAAQTIEKADRFSVVFHYADAG